MVPGRDEERGGYAVPERQDVDVPRYERHNGDDKDDPNSNAAVLRLMAGAARFRTGVVVVVVMALTSVIRSQPRAVFFQAEAVLCSR